MTWGEQTAREYDEERKAEDRLSEFKERYARNRGPLCAHMPPDDSCRVCRWEREAKMENGTQTRALAPSNALTVTQLPLDRHAFEPRNLAELRETAELLFGSKMLPGHIRSPQALVLQIMYGRELNLTVGQSIFDLYSVPKPDGTPSKPSMWTELLVARVRARPDICEYMTCVESTNERCVWEAKRKDSPKPIRSEWTIADANRAGLTNKPSWRAFPKRMLMWRAAADVVKTEFQDVTLGIAVREEIEDSVIDLERAPGLAEYAVPSAPAPNPGSPPDPLKAKLIASLEATGGVGGMRNVTPPPSTAREQSEPPTPPTSIPIPQAGSATTLDHVIASGGTSVTASARAANPPPEPQPVVPASSSAAPGSNPQAQPEAAPAPSDEDQQKADLERQRGAIWKELVEVLGGDTKKAEAAWKKHAPSKRGPKSLEGITANVAQARSLLERARIAVQIEAESKKLLELLREPEVYKRTVSEQMDLSWVDRPLELTVDQAKQALRALLQLVDDAQPVVEQDPANLELPWEPGANG